MIKKTFDVTYLSVDSIQEGVGSSQIIPLILGIAGRGRSVCLISFEKTKPNKTLFDMFSQAGVLWIIKDFGRPGAFGGLLRLNTLRKSVPSSRILHGRSDIATVAAILSGARTPTLWDVRSLWADQRLLIGSAGWNRVTAKAARVLENLAARKSSAMTTLTAAVVPILEQRHRSIPAIREVIPTCVQTSKFLASAMPSGQITCLLSGTFNNYYDTDRMKEVIEAIRRSVDMKVIWARADESPSEKLGVGEDVIISASHSQMPKIVKECHFGIAICKQDNEDSLAAAVPTKVAEFLASGRPVIVSRGIGDLEQMLSSTCTGVILDNNQSLENVTKQICDLINDPKTPERCRELAIQYFDMETSIDRYLEIYDRMLKS